ncbi:MAG: FG-GAP repeat protein [SAR202 cluster bacterium]|jgi:hypothetical protein|nr:FG-GAP repeat protein [SAR202 cluster bacterium]
MRIGHPTLNALASALLAALLLAAFGCIRAEQLGKLIAFDSESFDGFGRSVAIDGDILVSGSQFDDGDGPRSGSVYVYGVNGRVWELQTKITPDATLPRKPASAAPWP